MAVCMCDDDIFTSLVVEIECVQCIQMFANLLDNAKMLTIRSLKVNVFASPYCTT